MAVGGLQPWNTRRAQDYQAMAVAGARWLRTDLGWEYLEPAQGAWRFDEYDPVVADARSAGLRFLAILHTVPAWANNNAGDYGPPADPTSLTNYGYQTARHYIPLGVTNFEIGNEVNLPHPGWSTPTGAAYVTRVLAPCVAGVRRAASELGASVNVLLGSIAPIDWTGGADPGTFLSQVYGAGARALFDAVSWHPYTGDAPPAESSHMTADPDALYAVMAAHGDGAKKIWATEYGTPTGGPYAVSEATQAQMLRSAIATWGGKPFAGPMFWYSARDAGISATDREQHFGLLRHDGTPKAAYMALAQTLGRHRSSTPQAPG